MKRIITLLLISSMITLGFAGKFAVAEETAGLSVTAKSAVLIEGSTGKIIYENNKDQKLFPASITKIMTLLLIFEALEEGKITLEDQVTVSGYAASMGGSQVYLEPNEKQTVEVMIKCISIASANDACVAMAEFISGSEEEFVKNMNQRAKDLGMENTHFLNTCGLDDNITDGHYSTAYDIALMSRELITKYPQISDYATIWMDTIIHTTKKGDSEFGLTNTNKLVRTYDGITGLKTGSTSKAKFCLSATASRKGMNMIAVVMASETPKERFADAAKLLDYGFANCSLFIDEEKDNIIPAIPVKGGKEETIKGQMDEGFSYVCTKGEDPEGITKEIKMKEIVEAPIKTGDKIGEIQYYLSGEQIGSKDIVADCDVLKAYYKDYLYKLLARYFLEHKEKEYTENGSEQKGMEQNEMEQNEMEQNEMEQNETEQSETEQSETEQNETEQNKTEQNESE